MKLSRLLIAALIAIGFLAINSQQAKADIELDIHCGCQSPTPTLTIIPTPTETPYIPTPTPTDPPIVNCPQDYHLAANGRDCVQWELGGAPAPKDSGQVLGVSTSVLASTDSELTTPRVIFAIIVAGATFSFVKKYSL